MGDNMLQAQKHTRFDWYRDIQVLQKYIYIYTRLFGMGTVDDIYALGEWINTHHDGIMYSGKRCIIAAPESPREVARLDGSGVFNKAWVDDMLTSISLVDGGIVGSSGEAWELYRHVTGFDHSNHHLHITAWFNQKKYDQVGSRLKHRLLPLIESGEIQKPRNAYQFSKRITFMLLIEEVFEYYELTDEQLDELASAVMDLLNKAVIKQNVKIFPSQSYIDKLRSVVESYFDKIILSQSKDANNLASRIKLALENSTINKDQAVGLFIQLIVAGHDTTAAGLVWGLYSMATRYNEVPPIHGIPVEELVKKDSPAMRWINDYLNRHPSSPLMFRQTTRDCSIVINGQEYQVEKGTTVVFLIPTILRNNDTPYLASFSKGIRMCVGFPMALLEQLTFFDLLQEYQLKPVFDGRVIEKSSGGINVPTGQGIRNFYFESLNGKS